MIHTFVGNLGHFSVIIAFTSALVAAFSYGYAAKIDDKDLRKSWQKYARGAFVLHGLAVFTIIGSLFYIIYNHYYEYHYAWSHSSNNLPTHFMISCFW
ncbi:MAG: hypothetical protein AAGI07_12235 [Bacteroidota bacterium]